MPFPSSLGLFTSRQPILSRKFVDMQDRFCYIPYPSELSSPLQTELPSNGKTDVAPTIRQRRTGLEDLTEAYCIMVTRVRSYSGVVEDGEGLLLNLVSVRRASPSPQMSPGRQRFLLCKGGSLEAIILFPQALLLPYNKRQRSPFAI